MRIPTENAAEHWVTHAQFEHVSSYLQTSIRCLFDRDQPYFATWLGLYDICPLGSTFYMFTSHGKRGASPHYYAALCGFQDFVENLIVKYPQHVNASGGCYVASMLRRELTPAFRYGDVKMVQVLLNLGADVNIRNNSGESPLYHIPVGPWHSGDVPLNRWPMSLDYCLTVERTNARNYEGWTPLHNATFMRRIELIRVLLENGANVGAVDKQGRTPFPRWWRKKGMSRF